MGFNDITGSKAYLTWMMNPYDRENNYAMMADGYQNAVKRLLDSLLEDNSSHDADTVIFPILFCCHQCIELNLKASIIALHELESGNPWTAELEKTHSPITLIKHYNEANSDDSATVLNEGPTAALYDFIELCKLLGKDINNSYHPDFARFPESLPSKATKGKIHRYPFLFDSDDMTLDLLDVRKLLLEACRVSSGVFGMHQAHIDAREQLILINSDRHIESS